MQLINPFLMNEWKIRSFITVVLSFQFAMWGIIGVDAINLQIPFLRAIVSFIYLFFIPGIIILRILKLHKLGSLKTLLYSVGLSIATLMFIGAIINSIYPFIGISKPISIVPLISTISIVLILLCIICYKQDNGFYDVSFIEIREVLKPSTFFLVLLPFFTFFGTHLVNNDGNNILLLILLFILCLIPIFVAFDWIPKSMYPLAIFTISLSLLLHNSLISMYLVEWGDGMFEYYFLNKVITSSVWDTTYYNNLNAMLSIVMVIPIFSIISKLDPIWIIKIFLPFLFSLVPLGIYSIVRQQTSHKVAFLSSFLFTSTFTFFTTMLGMIRMQIAEIFLVLFILMVLEERISKINKSILIMIFAFSIIVSHYALSYIFIIMVIIALILLTLSEPSIMKKFEGYEKFGKIYNFLLKNLKSSEKVEKIISVNLAILLKLFALSWYMYNSNSSNFNEIVNVGNHILKNIVNDFMKVETTGSLRVLLQPTKTVIGSIHKIIMNITQFFIIIGILVSLFTTKERKINKEYLAMSMGALGILIISLIVPNFTQIGVGRLYHLSLVLLSFFCILGGLMVFEKITQKIKFKYCSSYESLIRGLSIFFAIYLLFNSALIYELAGIPNSFSLNPKLAPRPNFNEQEIVAADWIFHKKNQNLEVYADLYNAHLFAMKTGKLVSLRGTEEVFIPIQKRSYVFLGRENIIDGRIRLEDKKMPRLKYSIVELNNSKLFDIFNNYNIIYVNGHAQIHYP